MKTKSKLSKLGKSIVSVLLVLIMMVSMIAVSFTTANAGFITNVITGNWTALAFGTIERGTIFSLSKSMHSTSDQSLSTILNWTIRIAGGGQGIANSNITSMCQKMLTEIADIQADIEECKKDLDTIYEYLIDDSLYEKCDELNDIYIYYSNMLNDFGKLIDACGKYNEAFIEKSDTVNQAKKDLVTAYKNVYQTYYSDVNSQKSKFVSDLNDYLALISPYTSSVEIKDNSYITNPDTWGTKRQTSTILDCVYTCLTARMDYENNIYDGMTYAVINVANVGDVMMRSYRYWTELETMILLNDSTLSDTKLESEIELVWSDFNEASQKMVRGINQMCYSYEEVFTTYMRTYDTLIDMKINGYKGESGLYDAYKGYSGVHFCHAGSYVNDNYKLYADKVDETQYVYQFKVANDPSNTVYAVRNSNHTDNDDSANMTNKALTADNMIAHHICDFQPKQLLKYRNTGFSLDYLNLVKNSYSPGGYTMLDSSSDLNPIKNGENYNKDSNVLENITNQLQFTYGEELCLPADSEYMLLKTNINWYPEDNMMIHWDTDANTTWYNLSTGKEEKINGENDIHEEEDIKDTEILAMYSSNNPKMALKTVENGNGTTMVSTPSKNVGESTSATLNCGEVLTVKVKPDEGYFVDSVVIKDKNGKVLETLLSEECTEGMGVFVPVDSEGFYNFVLPVPYQDVTLEVNYSEITNQHQVNINDTYLYLETEHGMDWVRCDMVQFGNYDEVNNMTFSTGETVVVSVVTLDEYVCSGITLTTTNGKPLDVDIKDITSERLNLRPNEKIYSFTMPDEDVNVISNIEQGYTATICSGDNYSVKNYSAKFKNNECINLLCDRKITWDSKTSCINKPGETVTLKVEPKAGYAISEVKVFDDNDRKIDVTVNGSEYSFTMPEGNVEIEINSVKKVR